MNQSRYTPEAMAFISSVLEPGETLQELCDFGIPAKHPKEITAVLTDRYLHILDAEKTKQQGFKLVGQGSIPISKISTIVTGEKEPRRGHKLFILTIFWNGYQDTYATGWLEEGAAFAKELKHLIAKREM